MQIEKEIKQHCKEQRLRSLQMRYFDLEMDRLSLIANGDEEGAAATVKRQEAMQKAYEAVEEISTE